MTSARKLGIRAKLFFAFAAVSGTTVIAGGAAWLMFAQVRDLFHGVSGQNIPEIVETLGLQTDTQALAGSAPTLLAAKSQAQRQQEMTALKARQEGIAKRLDDIARTQSDREAMDRLKAFSLVGHPGRRNLHVCGEAFSDYQGFIEGALRSAAKTIDAIRD